MTNQNKIIAIVGICATLLIVILAKTLLKPSPAQPISSYEECVAQGYPILETYPEQCKTESGDTFTKKYAATQQPQSSQTSRPTTKPSQTAQKTTTKKTFTGKNVSFSYPETWNPKESALEPGTTKEIVNLGIPDVQSDQMASFFSLAFEEIKPQDSIEEKDITLGGQPGKKWIRHGEGYYTYAYYTKDPNTSGSFGISVTTPDRDIELEKQLDELAESVKWK